MALRFDDKWVWDFWFAQDGPDYHIFYLQADRSLGDEELRHWHVSVGHAVSQDLRNWDVLPDAIRPVPDGNAWDGKTTWTGSIIRAGGNWIMFYTGSSEREKGLVQRIGCVFSPDLIHWKRHPANPMIEANPRWYELLDLDVWFDQAWRDPYVFQHPKTGEYHAFITARAKSGPSDERGVIGHAVSPDLVQWEVREPLPLEPPGDFGYLEVPQLTHINGRYYLLFSAPAKFNSASRQARTGIPPEGGTHYMVADDPLGPYRYLSDNFLVGDATDALYSGKLIQGPDNNWYFMAFQIFNADGKTFQGYIPDPFPVTVADDGALTVVR